MKVISKLFPSDNEERWCHRFIDCARGDDDGENFTKGQRSARPRFTSGEPRFDLGYFFFVITIRLEDGNKIKAQVNQQGLIGGLSE